MKFNSASSSPRPRPYQQARHRIIAQHVSTLKYQPVLRLDQLIRSGAQGRPDSSVGEIQGTQGTQGIQGRSGYLRRSRLIGCGM